MSNLFVLPKQVPLDTAGNLISGAKAYFYRTGTSTPKNTYSDAALTTPHANPVVADAAGTFAPIFLDTSAEEYRLTLRTSADVLLYTQDNVGHTSGITQATIGAALFPRTAAEISAGVTPSNYAIPSHDACGRIYPKRYGCAADWTGLSGSGTDDLVNLRKCGLVAAVAGCPIDLAGGRYRIYSNTGDVSRLWTFTSLDGVTIIGGGGGVRCRPCILHRAAARDRPLCGVHECHHRRPVDMDQRHWRAR